MLFLNRLDHRLGYILCGRDVAAATSCRLGDAGRRQSIKETTLPLPSGTLEWRKELWHQYTSRTLTYYTALLL
jgi:hypothetical protein